MIAFLLLAALCGADHRAEKVLVDAGAAKALRAAPAPATIPALNRLAKTSPRTSYVVDGVIRAVKREADGDIHFALEDGGATMLVEFPDPRCAQGSPAEAAIARARRQAQGFRVGQRVRVAGMLFFDKAHGQRGAAKNGAELHPCYFARSVR